MFKILLFREHYGAYLDDSLIVNKISTGPAKGKITFKFKLTGGGKITNWVKRSWMGGCAEILDSEYENEPQIRNITIDSNKFRKVLPNMVDSVIFDFLIDYEDTKMSELIPVKDELRNRYEKDLKKIAQTSKNLGDAMDELRKVREKVRHYYKFHRDVQKYNL